MSDSTTMTVEFLRARLLSERSVSRAARERADQLAKRVMDLEEQLRIVSLQRKKAEVAALEAVSILQTHGVDDCSEVIDSSSEKDEIPMGEHDYEVTATGSKNEESKLDDAMSDSKLGMFASNAGSLSWRSHSGPDSHKRLKGKHFRQRQRRISLSPSSFESSPQHNLGKSCRKIKRREMGSTTEDERDIGTILDPDGLREEASRSDYAENQPDLLGEVSGNETCSADTQRNEFEADLSTNGTAGDEEMDRVLEQQALLISQYEEEEQAQREWEKKYNESNTSTLDHQFGEQLSMADNNIESQKDISGPCDQVPKSSEILTSGEEPRCGAFSDVSLLKALEAADGRITGRNPDESVAALSDTFVPTDSVKNTNGDYPSAFKAHHVSVNGSEAGNTVSDSGRAYLSLDGRQSQHSTSNFTVSSSSIGFSIGTHSDQMHSSSSARSPLIANYSRDSSKPVSSIPKDQAPSQLSQTSSNQFGGVLEALQRAKISLRQELHKPHLPVQGTMAFGATKDYHARPTVSTEPLHVPIGSAGLFRLPTHNLPPENSLKNDIYGKKLSLSSRYSQLPNPSYISESLFTSHDETTSRNYLARKEFDAHYSDMNLPASSRSSLPYLDSPADRSRMAFRSTSSASLGKQEFCSSSDAVGVSSSRYSLPYSDLTKDVGALSNRCSLPNSDSTRGVAFSPNRYPLPYSDTTRDLGVSWSKYAPRFSDLSRDRGFSSSRYTLPHNHLGFQEAGLQEATYNSYFGTTERMGFQDGPPTHPLDVKNDISPGDRYSPYVGNGTQNDKRI